MASFIDDASLKAFIAKTYIDNILSESRQLLLGHSISHTKIECPDDFDCVVFYTKVETMIALKRS